MQGYDATAQNRCQVRAPCISLSHRHGFESVWIQLRVVGAQYRCSLIKEKFDIRLNLALVGVLLARLNLTALKPLERAYQRTPKRSSVGSMRHTEQLSSRQGRKGQCFIFWDKSGFHADTVHGKTWAMRGETPVVHRPGQRQSISAASAVNSKGAFWFKTYKGDLTGKLFVDLLHQLMYRRKKPLHWIVDGPPAHKKAVVKDTCNHLLENCSFVSCLAMPLSSIPMDWCEVMPSEPA